MGNGVAEGLKLAQGGTELRCAFRHPALQFGIESFDRSFGKLALRQIGADADDVRLAAENDPPADDEEATRRIVAAAVELLSSTGTAITIADVAESLGVIRQTVYRGLKRVDQHFKLTMTVSNIVRMARMLGRSPLEALR